MSNSTLRNRSQQSQRRRFAATVIDTELAKARGRIRAVDFATALLALVLGTLAYGLVVVALDHWLQFPDLVRQLLLGAFVIGAGVFIFFRLVLPLSRQINPYFAARALEQSAPDPKNGLVNWLDLREQPMSPAIRGAIQDRALTELEESNIEEAVPVRRPMRLFFTAAGLIFALFLFAISMPDQIGSLLRRAFFPFQPTFITAQTRLQLVKPITDDILDDPASAETKEIPVEPGEPVRVAVEVHGTVPLALNLEYQNSLDEQPLVMSLAAPSDEFRRQPWTVTLPSDRIPADGLWFKVRGGTGQTRQYRLVVASKKPPSVSDIDVRYQYPAYTKRPDRIQHFAHLKALVGTKVQLSVNTDQPATRGEMEVQVAGKKVSSMLLEAAPDNQRRLASKGPFELTPALKGNASYRLKLLGKDGKEGVSPPYREDPYGIKVEEDLAPSVTIQSIGQVQLDPKQDRIELPLNDVAPVIGQAQDDVAVSDVRLRLKREGGQELRLLSGKGKEGPLQKATGYALPPADYQFVLDLTKLGLADGKDQKPLELQVGQVLDCWVEATDNCEPKANVGESQHIKIALTEPLNKEQREEKERQAEQKRQEREERQQGGQEKDKDETEKGEGKTDRPQPESKPDNQEQGGSENKKGENKQPQDQGGQPKSKDDPKNTDQNKEKTDGKAGAGQEPENKRQPQPKEPKPSEAQKNQPRNQDKNTEKPDQTQKQPSGAEQKNDGTKPPENSEKGDPSDPKKQPAPEKSDQRPDGGKNEQKPSDEKPKPHEGQNGNSQPGQTPGKKEQKPSGADKKPSEKPDKGNEKGQPQPQPGQGKKDDKPDPKPADSDKNPPEKGEPKPKPQPGDEGKGDKPEQQPKPQASDEGKGEKPDQQPPKANEKEKGESPKGSGESKESKDDPKEKGDEGNQGQQQSPKEQGGKPQPQQSGEQKPGDKNKATPEQRKQAEDATRKADELAKAMEGSGASQGNPGPKNAPDDPNAKHQRKATDLLLETFREQLEKGKVDKDVLKQMKWDEKQARAFLDEYEKLKKQGLIPSQEEAARGQGGKQLRGGGPREGSTRTSKPLDAAVDPALQPPPELQDYFQEFSKQLSKQPKK